MIDVSLRTETQLAFLQSGGAESAAAHSRRTSARVEVLLQIATHHGHVVDFQDFVQQAFSLVQLDPSFLQFCIQCLVSLLEL